MAGPHWFTLAAVRCSAEALLVKTSTGQSVSIFEAGGSVQQSSAATAQAHYTLKLHR